MLVKSPSESDISIVSSWVLSATGIILAQEQFSHLQSNSMLPRTANLYCCCVIPVSQVRCCQFSQLSHWIPCWRSLAGIVHWIQRESISKLYKFLYCSEFQARMICVLMVALYIQKFCIVWNNVYHTTGHGRESRSVLTANPLTLVLFLSRMCNMVWDVISSAVTLECLEV